MHPLKMGTSDSFEALRRLLSESNYTEEAVCRRVQIPSIYDFKTSRERRQQPSEVTDAQDVLIRLLMDEEALPAAVITDHLGSPALRVFDDLGLLKPLSADPSCLYADVVLYPQEGLFIVSDRTFQIEPKSGGKLPEDVVYASITRNTGRFVSILPDDPCESFLEMCSGTGIAALLAARRYATHSWACDLSGRCTHFARFNASLNGIDNMTAVQGDLYGPVEGLTFDRIAAHPPYVPAEEQKLMFRDGGQDGEQILRGIVQGLPQFLNPGGRFYALSLVTDREGEQVEARVRKWLGDAEADFDVFMAINDAERKPAAILQAVAEARGKLGELGSRSRMYEQLKVETVLYGVVVVERHATARAPLTARCQKSQQSSTGIVEWFRKWQLATAEPTFLNLLIGTKPRLGAGMTLSVTHEEQGGQLLPAEFRVRVKHPLVSDARIEPWVAALIGACDGSRTGVELFGYLREQEVIAERMRLDEFADVLRLLIESGFLEIDEFVLPRMSRKTRQTAEVGVQE